MRTTTTIEGLTLEDLVTLFATAEGSSWLEIDTTDQTEVEAEDGDCREDIWAKALLLGEYIACIDHYAEGEIYGILGTGVVSNNGDETVCYLVTLQDVIDGLQKCADGTFKGDKSEHDWLKDCFSHLLAGGFDLDLPEAEALMQVIMFDELIYG